MKQAMGYERAALTSKPMSGRMKALLLSVRWVPGQSLVDGVGMPVHLTPRGEVSRTMKRRSP